MLRDLTLTLQEQCFCGAAYKAKKGNGCKNKIYKESEFFEKLNKQIGIEGGGDESDYENVKRIIVGEDGELTVEYK